MASRGSFSLLQQSNASVEGPLAYEPKPKERVYYFPQCHMEQLEASTNQELNQRIQMFGLPSKILCIVVDIKLLVDDFVFKKSLCYSMIARCFCDWTLYCYSALYIVTTHWYQSLFVQGSGSRKRRN